MPCAVDPAANLIDARCNAIDGGSQLFLLGVIDLDDVPVDQHLPGIRAEVVRLKLVHFVLNEIPFRFIQADFLTDWSCAFWHIETLLSNYNGHFCCKTQVSPAKNPLTLQRDFLSLLGGSLK